MNARHDGLIDVLGASNWELERFKSANDYANEQEKVWFQSFK